MNIEWAVINLIEIICSVLIGIICAMFTRLLMFCIGNPHFDENTNEQNVSKNIFSFYGRWILRKYTEVELKKNYTGINFWKAMGVCQYCLNVYVTFVLSFFIVWQLDIPFWWLLLISGISYVSLTRIYANEY